MTNFSDDDMQSLDGDDIQEEPGSMSLMGGIAQGDGFDAADLDITAMDNNGGVLSKGTLLILLIVMIAAGSLYAMRATQSDMSSDDKTKQDEAKVEDLLIRIKADGEFRSNLQPDTSTTDEILSHLSNNATEKQVPVELTKKNPFVLAVEKKVVVKVDTTPTVDQSKVAAQRAREQLMRKLNKEKESLTLQSVVPNGRRPVAIVNNKIVQVGGMVGSFKVTKIENVSVHLVASGETFLLTLKTDNN